MQFILIVCYSFVLLLSVTNAKNDTQVENFAYDDQQDPYLWQRSGKYQGDIVLTSEQAQYLFSENEERNGIIKKKLHWPNREIPYIISDDFSASQKRYIEKVLKEDYDKTCIRIVPRTNQTHYVYVTGKNTGCWSYVGRLGKKQELNLQLKGCLYHSTIVHEFLHAAGFHHQQSATERDDYVTIQWENIEKGKSEYFEKYKENKISSFGQPYDYYSLMHFSAYAFSKNGEKTIVPKQDVQLGAAPRLTSIDIAKLNKMYDC